MPVAIQERVRKGSAARVEPRGLDAPGHVFWLMGILAFVPLPSLLADRYNYTWSLLIFLVPIAAILWWFVTTPENELEPDRNAFLVTLSALVASGALLNLLFADDFFSYPNTRAVLGCRICSIPALDFFSVDFEHPIPIEEFAFYISGFLAMLLVYLWGDLHFFSAYRKEPGEAPRRRLIQFSARPFLMAGALLLVGLVVKSRFGGGGFPGYLAYLLFVPFLITTLLYRTAVDHINWRAFIFMFVMILGSSVMWEVSLALPDGWWAYQNAPMLGLYFAKWSNLPLEAMLVWFLAAITTAVTFEAMKIFFRMERPVRDRLFREGI
jgi:hypothetical protein